jgi:hypothetical protein
MSAWRRIATEKIPKQRELIQTSESVGMLWVDLWLRFMDAHHDPVDDETIRGVYEFARWTWKESRSEEMATSTCCHFYEHLPTEPLVRARLRRFMTRDEILELAEVFKHHMSQDEHREFMREFSAVSK